MNEDEIADKVYEERERIVDLYRNGPGDGTIIDPVDDPAYNDYNRLDKFGFIWYSKIVFSSKIEVFIYCFFHSDVSKLKKEDPQEIKIERIREQKWLKMIHNWDKVPPEKLKRRVFKGIPNSLRGKVWAKLLRVDQLTDDQKNKYKVIIYFYLCCNFIDFIVYIIFKTTYLKIILNFENAQVLLLNDLSAKLLIFS